MYLTEFTITESLDTLRSSLPGYAVDLLDAMRPEEFARLFRHYSAFYDVANEPPHSLQYDLIHAPDLVIMHAEAWHLSPARWPSYDPDAD